VCSNAGDTPMTDFVMQAAVPTVMQLQLAAATGSVLSPYRSKCVGAASSPERVRERERE
jgi:hypothetical protein